MTININVVHSFKEKEDALDLSAVKLLLSIYNQNKNIMEALESLNEKISGLESKVDTLQTTIDTDQASDAQVVSDLTAANNEQKAIIADLQEQLAGSIDPAAIQAAADRLTAVSEKVDTAIADVAGPNAVDPAPPVDGL